MARPVRSVAFSIFNLELGLPWFDTEHGGVWFGLFEILGREERCLRRKVDVSSPSSSLNLSYGCGWDQWCVEKEMEMVGRNLESFCNFGAYNLYDSLSFRFRLGLGIA